MTTLELAATDRDSHLRLSLTFDWAGSAPPAIADLGTLIQRLTFIADNAERASGTLGTLTTGLPDITGPTATRIRVRRIEFGSPLSMTLGLPEAITVGSVGLPILLYMIKRAFGFSLEVRAHRERERQGLLEAQAECARLEMEILALRRTGRRHIPEMPTGAEGRRVYDIDSASNRLDSPVSWEMTEGTLTDDVDEDQFV